MPDEFLISPTGFNSVELVAGYDVALELDQVWRYVPYCDDDQWAAHAEEFGWPAYNIAFTRRRFAARPLATCAKVC